jgi:1-aminocyclopropane-1-carboxylate deaminase/D-cysteine desulfhydrase-like pyridoxal-dependent ACC family enzyme
MRNFSYFYIEKSGDEYTNYPSKHIHNTVALYSDKSCKEEYIIGTRTSIAYGLVNNIACANEIVTIKDKLVADHIVDVTFSLNNGHTLSVKFTRMGKEEVELTPVHATGLFRYVSNIKRSYINDNKRELIFEY